MLMTTFFCAIRISMQNEPEILQKQIKNHLRVCTLTHGNKPSTKLRKMGQRPFQRFNHLSGSLFHTSFFAFITFRPVLKQIPQKWTNSSANPTWKICLYEIFIDMYAQISISKWIWISVLRYKRNEKRFNCLFIRNPPNSLSPVA